MLNWGVVCYFGKEKNKKTDHTMKRQGEDKVYTWLLMARPWSITVPPLVLPTSDNTTAGDCGETNYWQQNWLCGNALAPRLSTSKGRAGAKPSQTRLFHRPDMANPCLSGKHQAVPGWKCVTSISNFKRLFPSGVYEFVLCHEVQMTMGITWLEPDVVLPETPVKYLIISTGIPLIPLLA